MADGSHADVHVDALLDRLEVEGPLLAAAAGEAGWDATVPGTQWCVRELVTHVGGVHRWASAVVARRSADAGVPELDAVGTGPADDDLLEWFGEGHRELVDTLRAAPEDLRCFTFLPAGSPRHFWCRRQAHETAIHRADVDGAAGRQASFPADFAQDGIAEMLRGFGARRNKSVAVPGVIALRAEDGPSWRVTLGGQRTVAEPVVNADRGADGDAVVTGSSSALYLWLWNRRSQVRIDGDAALAAQWRSVRVEWG